MDAASLFGNANLFYVNEEYEEALKHYTCAVTLQDCAEYRSCRAATYLKLGKFSETLEDVEAALTFDANSHMAMHWKGIALFYVGDFVGAKTAFEASLRSFPTGKTPRAIWVRKCDAELSGSTLPLSGLAAQVSKATSNSAPVGAVASTSAVAPAAAATPTAAPAAVPNKADLSISGRKPIRREFYQNATHVFLTIFAKNLSEDVVKADFQDKELSVTFPLPGADTEEYQLDLALFDVVVPAHCKVEVSKVKVEVTLMKKIAGLHWKDIEKVEEVASSADQPAYPTSNKAKKNWSQIDKDIEAEIKGDKPEGDEALNSLFKQIYGNADDETRKAMNKSFQTSGGTVLSTNWGEVGRADYEGKDRPTAPEGQEWASHLEKK